MLLHASLKSGISATHTWNAFIMFQSLPPEFREKKNTFRNRKFHFFIYLFCAFVGLHHQDEESTMTAESDLEVLEVKAETSRHVRPKTWKGNNEEHEKQDQMLAEVRTPLIKKMVNLYSMYTWLGKEDEDSFRGKCHEHISTATVRPSLTVRCCGTVSL